MSDTRPSPRNFGPEIGCVLLSAGDRLTPRFLEQPLVYLVALVGLVLARRNIRHSRAYLTAITGRPAGIFRVWKHYQRMIINLARKLRATRGVPMTFIPADETACREFKVLAASDEQALFGTFHVGDSDLLGAMLSEQYSRKMAMIRLRVGNAEDTERLARRFAGGLEFLWVDRPEEIIFRIKDALDSGRSLAMQCDREEHASKCAYFRFLGARRRFPVTIYHLAAVFGKPVVFAFALPRADHELLAYTSSVFRPRPGASREEILAEGEAHFQGVLDLLESRLREDPYQWFNFIPLNPTAEDAAAA